MKSLNTRLLKAAIFLGILMLTIGCGKEENTLAKIRVINEQNQPVSEAKVILFPNPSPQLGQMVAADTAFTDTDGRVIFDYTAEFQLGTAGFRILDIQVSKDDMAGTGIIKIVEEEENVATIVISLP